jgi:hypothetical protein
VSLTKQVFPSQKQWDAAFGLQEAFSIGSATCSGLLLRKDPAPHLMTAPVLIGWLLMAMAKPSGVPHIAGGVTTAIRTPVSLANSSMQLFRHRKYSFASAIVGLRLHSQEQFGKVRVAAIPFLNW